jgi:polysaccharide export outer membrane protein
MKLLKRILLNSLTICLMLMAVFACVPRKKLIYLQPDPQIDNSTFYYDEREYRLKPDDVISVNVFSLTPGQFNFLSAEGGSGGATNQFTINREGQAELPALGFVNVEGLTLVEAQEKIKSLLQDYLQSPLVQIRLVTPFTFTMLGEVNGPGSYTLQGVEPNIMQAIAQAGDLTVFADRENVRILRKEDGEVNIYELNLLEDQAIASPLYQLKPEDIVIIDPLQARTIQENRNYVFGFISIFTSLGLLAFNIFRFSR